jgi:hypothetical protein
MRKGVLMKRWLSILLVFWILPVAVFAQLPPVGYIGLYTDELHNEWCAVGAGFYLVQMWAWCLPSERGMICAEFRIDYPANVIQSSVTWNQPWFIDPPDLEEGASVCLLDCQWDWYWLFHQQLWVTDPGPTYVEIVEFPFLEVPVMQFANCEPGYPVETVKKYTNLYINYDLASPECSGTAAETGSWGAIKKLMR